MSEEQNINEPQSLAFLQGAVISCLYTNLIKKQKNMNAKEKAKEIYCKYADALNIRDLQTTANPFAKQCALIAVDEIINHHSQEQGLYRIDTYYWNAVKSVVAGW